MELLFARLAAGPLRRAVGHVARWAATTTLPSVTSEASVVVNAAVTADPELAAQLLLQPLLGRVESELGPAAAATASEQLSKVCPAPCCAAPCCNVLVSIQLIQPQNCEVSSCVTSYFSHSGTCSGAKL